MHSKFIIMNWKNIFVFITLLLIVYYLGSWLVIFNSYDSHIERQHGFIESWLFFNSVGTINLTMVILTVGSLIINLKFDRLKESLIGKIALGFQLFFLMFILSSYL